MSEGRIPALQIPHTGESLTFADPNNKQEE
jgi:hypothetical protein